MTSVTVQLTPEAAQQLRLQADQRGQTLEEYLGHVAEKQAHGGADAADPLRSGLDWLTHRGAAEVQAARERILGAAPAPQPVPAGKTVLDAIEGTWPGTETDAQIQEALDRNS